MAYGYIGKVCIVDLTRGTITEESLPESVYRSFLGGEGLGVKILYERQRAKVDALGPENILSFATGLLTGCGVPSASRCMVITKSPLTGTLGDANVGGHFGPELKACGYDAVFFKGIAPHPVYLLLTESTIELRDAAHLWGRDTAETLEILRRETGDPDIKVACIGPAGEALSLISAIIMGGRAAARSGVGAVMGAKRLKAIAVRGRKKVKVAHPETIKLLRRNFIRDLRESDQFLLKALKQRGTCDTTSMCVSVGHAPIKNWNLSGEEAMPTHSKLSGESVTKYQVRKAGCAGCPIMCGGIVKIDSGQYRVTETRKPEYETLVAFGIMCLNDDVESVIKANDICDRYGIDTISAGATIAFAMECYERGVISRNDTGGIKLTWGNAPAIVSMLEKMARREGFGAILADGAKRAAEQIGHGSEEYAIHIHGQEIPYHDPRLTPSYAAYISDPTPGRHMRATFMLTLESGGILSPYPELRVPAIEPTDNQGRAPIYAIGAKYFEVIVCCGFCAFVPKTGTLPLVAFISAATAWDFSASELLATGERIQTLRQEFNVREGLRPHDFYLPQRVAEPPSVGPLKGITYDFDTLRKVYYKAMNWDSETGEPSTQRLQELGLREIVKSSPLIRG